MQKNLASVRNYQEDVESTENQIKQNIRDCESKLQLEQQRQNEVEILRQQIDKLKNDLRTYPEEQGKKFLLLIPLTCLKIYHFFIYCCKQI